MCKKKKICLMIIGLLTVLSGIICGIGNRVEAGQKTSSKTVTVLVDLNGGNVNGNTEYALIGKPGEKVILTNPIYEGYEFAGYDCGNGTLTLDKIWVYTFGNTNTRITAIWKKQSETLMAIETPTITTQHAITITEVPVILETPKIIEVSDITETPKATEQPEIIENPETEEMLGMIENLETEQAPDTMEKPQTVTTLLPLKTPISITDAKTKVYLEKSSYYVAYKSKVKPKIKITYSDKELIKNKDYKIVFRKNNQYGRAQIVIKGIRDYTGVITKKFYILPAKTKIEKCSVTMGNKGRIIKIVWKKLKGIDGYQILYSKKKKGSFKEISKKSQKQNCAAFWFGGKEIYYIKVRPYVIIDGKYKYGESNIKAIK